MRIIIFLILNFAGLIVGGLFTGTGVPSDWYEGLSKAPWTPPGWVFGAAWTTIMICFSVYMAKVWKMEKDTKLVILLFGGLWILNVSWNPIFFHFHNTFLGLVVISSLTLLVGYVLNLWMKQLKLYSLLLAPYLIWLLIATSLNAYIVFNN